MSFSEFCRILTHTLYQNPTLPFLFLYLDLAIGSNLDIFRLMAKPDKPVFIPERRVDRDVNKAPEFNHNIMGRRVEEIVMNC